MPRTNITFTGNDDTDIFSLLGVSYNEECKNNNLSVIEKIKNNIINMFLIPLCSEQIEMVDRNSIVISMYLKYLNGLPGDYTYYIRLLEYIQKNISDLKELQKVRDNQRKNGDLRMKLFRVELSPEYLLYYSIYGKPKTRLIDGDNRLKDIKKILEDTPIDKLSFDYINEKILTINNGK